MGEKYDSVSKPTFIVSQKGLNLCLLKIKVVHFSALLYSRGIMVNPGKLSQLTFFIFKNLYCSIF